ncbi:hypothetical protein PoB_002222800 [Plakobranchus ocellatus]|uniref:Uncharacterized protein n=1 Tax=Plakobranchus ocellatus TaxID=259542 RepID=A0AAV3ZMP8_9GAST|nr:hypothetical protein PoB_002222800 [Plakobranchus ocellatus]
MISSREDASVIRERDIRAAQQYQRKLSRGSETIIFAAPRSRHADVAKSYNFRNAQCATSYVNSCGLHLISCNWSKSYTRFEFYHIVQEPMENDPELLSKIISSDEATFHLNNKYIHNLPFRTSEI